jgi:hypothetical protein
MQTEEITIRVPSDDAKSYRESSPEERKKLDLLLAWRLHDALHVTESLEDVMDQMSHMAQERGLTPEILESILNER